MRARAVAHPLRLEEGGQEVLRCAPPELARRILNWEANGSRPGELIAPTAVFARFAIAVPGLAMLGWWLG
ncbi:hypothetical protein AB0919_07835 [Streptomyces sp. NPDC046994]|uniref:hypothetical protein n=1 Tax=unclassified Streptomyces TaxID=2593676 RepID=UPI0033E34859